MFEYCTFSLQIWVILCKICYIKKILLLYHVIRPSVSSDKFNVTLGHFQMISLRIVEVNKSSEIHQQKTLTRELVYETVKYYPIFENWKKILYLIQYRNMHFSIFLPSNETIIKNGTLFLIKHSTDYQVFGVQISERSVLICDTTSHN